MVGLKCGCDVRFEWRYNYCPYCGKYIKDLFLGQPFMNGSEETPLYYLLKHIYSDKNKIAGKILSKDSGYSLLRDIYAPIERADLCFFDLTNNNFNVALEMGYAISCAFPQSQKYILVGCTSKKDAILSKYTKMDILPSLPQLPEYLQASKAYYKIKDIEKTGAAPDVRDSIISCEDEIKKAIFDKDMPSKIDDFYEKMRNPGKTKSNDFGVITLHEKEDVFKNIESLDDSITSFELVFTDNFFEGVRDIKYLIERITNQIIAKFDYLIIHLVSNEKDSVTGADEHNFKAGLIAGFMEGFKLATESGYQSNFYIAHKDGKVHCSDVPLILYSSDDNIAIKIKDSIIQYIKP